MRGTTTILLVAAFLSGGYHREGAAVEERAARYLDSIRQQPLLLLAFLREMPKGGDLHNHLAGAIYAETFINFAARPMCLDQATGKSADMATAECIQRKGKPVTLCFDRKSGELVSSKDEPCNKQAGRPEASDAYGDPDLYREMVDGFSMRDFVPRCDSTAPSDNAGTVCESAHDHFFAAFSKFGAASKGHTAEMLAEASRRAASDHLQFLELMHTADGGLSKALGTSALGTDTDWNNGFAAAREKLLPGLREIVKSTREQLDRDEAKAHSLLNCGTANADPGCDVSVRYLYQVLRAGSPEQVFAQIVLGFELASADPRFVGLNLVQPEDWYVPMHDFRLHMSMLDFLHGVYPNVHITLHAGELAMGLVPPEGLTFHIRESVERGHAERIGHGVSVMNERDPLALMREIAQRDVLVEICLTSNDMILGVRGQEHPLPVYQREGVPVALSTDDEGVSRSDMTHEWLRAVETYHLSYAELKRMARQSLEHSFLPGASLWQDTHDFRRISPCSREYPVNGRLSKPCQDFLNGSERARLQWKLETEFGKFEKKF